MSGKYVILGSDFSTISINTPYIQMWGDDTSYLTIDDETKYVTDGYVMSFLSPDTNNLKIHNANNIILNVINLSNIQVQDLFAGMETLKKCTILNAEYLSNFRISFNGCTNFRELRIGVSSYLNYCDFDWPDDVIFDSCWKYIRVLFLPAEFSEMNEDYQLFIFDYYSYIASCLSNSGYEDAYFVDTIEYIVMKKV